MNHLLTLLGRRWVGVLVIALAVSCRGERDAPVATVDATFGAPAASLDGPIDVTFRFTASDGFPSGGNYWVMAHFVSPQGETVWNDDHRPPTPTSQWQPGRPIEYTRHLFVPTWLTPGDLRLAVGLYSPDTEQRLPLAGTEVEHRAYGAASVRIEPSDVLEYGDGWHAVEGPPRGLDHWRWTKDRAVARLRNPQTDATLLLNVQAADQYESTPRATVTLNGHRIDEFDVPSKERLLRRVAVTKDVFGPAPTAELTIAVDRTFVPSEVPGTTSSDSRTLGIRAFNVALVPAGR